MGIRKEKKYLNNYSPPQREDSSQHKGLNSGWMCDGVREWERRAPAASEHDPLVDPQLLPQRLDVRDQVPGRVLLARLKELINGER